MKIDLRISPCPNDTFMFDAMINGRVDTEGLEFDVTYADIEELNRGLIEGKPQVSKASYAIFPIIRSDYRLLRSGSALGNGNGPLLVASDEDADLSDFEMRIAVPGEHTTANLLMNKLYPHLSNKRYFLFSDIMDIVASGKTDAGVLIHEGRFVYHHRGLYLLADLGIEWEKRTGLPLPLGAIMVSRKVDEDTRLKIECVLRRSIQYAMDNPAASADFVRSHAQEMDEKVISDHISLFVNARSLDLGNEGVKAVSALTGVGEEHVLA